MLVNTSIHPLLRLAANAVAVSLCLIGATSAQAHWELNNQLSQLNFLTIKAGNVAEIHSFKSLSGTIDPEGRVTVHIATASVDTLIPIRNERLREILLQSEAFPTAEFTTAIDSSKLNSLAVGTSEVVEIQGHLTLLDKTISVSASVLATKVNNRAVLVHTLKPILVDASSFGLADAVEQLREVANLPSISLSVPVTFTLTFSG